MIRFTARLGFAASTLSIALTFATVAAPAIAGGVLKAEYFLLPDTHPDTNHGADMKIATGLVRGRLGPDGLPVVSTLGRTYAGSSGPITDVNGAGELMWYSVAGKNHVLREKTITESLPIEHDRFYPAGKDHDGAGAGYLAVHWSGHFTVPKTESIGLDLGSDDDSWVFIDGRLVVDNGGVKPLADAPFTFAHLTAGVHELDVFYADRHNSGAQIHLKTNFAVAPGPAGPAGAKPVTASAPNAANIAATIRKTGHVAVYGLHFAFDSAALTADSTKVLAEVAKVLAVDGELRLRIEGHTDGAGDAAYNRDLSGRRAAAVKAALVRRFGIRADRLTTQGFGPDRPVATNATSVGRAANRRVELVRL